MQVKQWKLLYLTYLFQISTYLGILLYIHTMRYHTRSEKDYLNRHHFHSKKIERISRHNLFLILITESNPFHLKYKPVEKTTKIHLPLDSKLTKISLLWNPISLMVSPEQSIKESELPRTFTTYSNFFLSRVIKNFLAFHPSFPTGRG